MEIDAQTIAYVNFFITIAVGVGLILIIRHKNSLIKTLTAQLDSAQKINTLYDANKYKEHQKISEEILEMKYQKVLSDTEIATLKGIDKGAKSFAIKYTELINFNIHYFKDMDKENRDVLFILIPENRALIEHNILIIKGQNSRQGN